jgi:hypothetical protein
MMDCFVVWIQANHGGRWVDSIYVEEATADARVEQLKTSMRGAGHTVDTSHHWAWKVPAKIEDGVLGKAKT